jgi:hypothetical protein
MKNHCSTNVAMLLNKFTMSGCDMISEIVIVCQFEQILLCSIHSTLVYRTSCLCTQDALVTLKMPFDESSSVLFHK